MGPLGAFFRCKFTEEKTLPENLGTYFRDFLCEFLGMFYVMFIGCSCFHKSRFKAYSYAGGILGFSFIIASCIQFMQFTSGGHLNTAVTLALFLMGHFSIYRAISIILGQICGGTLGVAVLKHLLGYNDDSNLCCTIPQQECLFTVTAWEFVSTCVLLTTFYSVVDETGKYVDSTYPIKVGIALISTIYTVGEFTGCSMNPARSLAPALITNCWDGHWAYWIGPLSASVFSSQIWLLIFSKRTKSKDEKRKESDKLSGSLEDAGGTGSKLSLA